MGRSPNPSVVARNPVHKKRGGRGDVGERIKIMNTIQCLVCLSCGWFGIRGATRWKRSAEGVLRRTDRLNGGGVAAERGNDGGLK